MFVMSYALRVPKQVREKNIVTVTGADGLSYAGFKKLLEATVTPKPKTSTKATKRAKGPAAAAAALLTPPGKMGSSKTAKQSIVLMSLNFASQGDVFAGNYSVAMRL